MLRRIQGLLNERGRLSLRELALILDMEASALEPMLEMLVRKGRIEVLDAGCSTRSCTGCSCSSRDNMIIYKLPDSVQKM
ncbi:sugar metabolism transcriptional regulator [Candidatus Fermentibacteria bacterium]|nr:MAG: sugar metabolism transcriptional regulator [Candidatus Fermentibacteria bacterium]PIE51906.1 MAG: sugar metabolism transcriptional regulator [Candidatus Fermentibacteria bacterium]PIE53468.1 MAG: sugar metabolism transcriptional regulator [Candidatus Fermentibacteria bacterium]